MGATCLLGVRLHFWPGGSEIGEVNRFLRVLWTRWGSSCSISRWLPRLVWAGEGQFWSARPERPSRRKLAARLRSEVSCGTIRGVNLLPVVRGDLNSDSASKLLAFFFSGVWIEASEAAISGSCFGSDGGICAIFELF